MYINGHSLHIVIITYLMYLLIKSLLICVACKLLFTVLYNTVLSRILTPSTVAVYSV